MVERLKKAIDKARAQREQVLVGAPPASVTPKGVPRAPVEGKVSAEYDPWAALEEITLDAAHLKRMRIVSYGKNDPAHVAFDVLRTRLLKVFKDKGWSRLAITAPTAGCGKTFVAANLAFSLARRPECRTVLIDMDLKMHGLSRAIGDHLSCSIEGYVKGHTPPEEYLRRAGPNLALGLNTGRVRDSAELIQDERTARALGQLCETYQPNVIIYDLPPVLMSDDVIGFLPYVDCTLLVAAAGETTAAQIEECERLFSESTAMLGVVLNKCVAGNSDGYLYSYYR